MESNPFTRFAENMARMRANAEGPFVDDLSALQDEDALNAELPEQPCHRTRNHPRHVEYSDPGAPFPCPGVGNFATIVEPPVDPFAGLPALDGEWD